MIENQVSDTTFCNNCFEDVCIENDNENYLEGSKLSLYHITNKNIESMLKVENNINEHVTKKTINQDPIYVNAHELKWDFQNSTYQVKKEICNQNVKLLNHVHVDLNKINNMECKELIKNNSLNEKKTITQDNKHEATIENDQGEEKMVRNYNKNYSNFISLKDQSTNKETMV